MSKYDYLVGIMGKFVDSSPYDFNNKYTVIRDNIKYLLCKTQSMFKYNNLPNTIPVKYLELYLQLYGHCCITKINDNLYTFFGNWGGTPDVYYLPTEYIVANPGLNFNKTLTINKDCVVLGSDSLYSGLLPIFRKYSTLLAENELSIKIAEINTRIINLISAPDDRTKKAAEKYLEDICAGKHAVIADNYFLDGVKVNPTAERINNNIIQLIELEQYLKGSLFHEIGINSNFNMKREALNTAESSLNTPALLPLIDDMFKARKDGIEKVNTMYNTNITVELNSAWSIIDKESESVLIGGDKNENSEKSN